MPSPRTSRGPEPRWPGTHPPPPESPPRAGLPLASPEYRAARAAELRARVIDRTPPDSAKLFIRPVAGGVYRGFVVHPAGGDGYAASRPGESLAEGPHAVVGTLFRGGPGFTCPGAPHRQRRRRRCS